MSGPVGKERIRGLVPHAGSMCLLDAAERWDKTSIICQAHSHRAPDHPLRRDGRLAAVHLVEYCAQAMALHRGLVSESEGERAPQGWLVSARDFKLHVARLDDLEGPLTIRARELVYFEGGTQYDISAEAAGRVIGGGRISVVKVPGQEPG
jgi:predicted hotdog family 3-hydroxylacyl-ACP dehydratase